MTRTSRQLFFGLLAILPSVAGFAADTTDKFLPASNPYARQLLIDDFRLIKNRNELGPEVAALFSEHVPPQDISNRGELFNPTEGPGNPRAPSRRFVLAGVSANLCFVLYEVGGIAHYANLLIFAKQNKWRQVAAVTGPMNENTFDALKESVKGGRFFEPAGGVHY